MLYGIAACLVMQLAGCGFGDRGELREVHSFPGNPTVEIYQRGFPESTEFDAYVVTKRNRDKVLAGLPCGTVAFDTTNFPSGNYGKRWIPASCTPQPSSPWDNGLFRVWWSKKGNRFAIAFNGFLVAGYDVTTKQRLPDTEKVRRYVSTGPGAEQYHAALCRFLDETNQSGAKQ